MKIMGTLYFNAMYIFLKKNVLQKSIEFVFSHDKKYSAERFERSNHLQGDKPYVNFV